MSSLQLCRGLAVVFPLCCVHSLPPSVRSLWFWVTLQCSAVSAEFSCCSFRRTHTHTHTHARTLFLRHKTMSAGRLFLAARSSVYCMILAVLKENLCSHTYSVTLPLPLLSPPENWISGAVVPCDVPVPDKSLTSPRRMHIDPRPRKHVHAVGSSWWGHFKASAFVLLTVAHNVAGVSVGV